LVVLKEGSDASQEEIIEFCKARVADYKKPRTVEFVPSLPRSGPGKIAKNALREKYWAGLERKVN
jgi:acyl-CoA synthetase (AMP-forming)/AMP-acid ligase II